MIDDQKIIDEFKKSGINDIDRFFATSKEFTISKNNTKKISINKSEIIKAVNIDAESGEPRYFLSPISYDSKVKDEDKTVKDMQKWLEEQQKKIEKELKSVYKGSF